MTIPSWRHTLGWQRAKTVPSVPLRFNPESGSTASRAVHRQPVQPELAHRVDELVEVHRLADIAVRPEVVALDDVALFVGGREDHDRQGAGGILVADAVENFEAANLRQLQV